MSEQAASTKIEIEAQDGMSLHQLGPYDAQAYFDLIDADREHLSQFGDGTAIKYPSVDTVRESIVNPEYPTKLRFGIWQGGAMVGSINLSPDTGANSAEVGYWIGKPYIGYGYARKATEALIEYVFEVTDLEVLYAEVAVGNEASRKTLERAGFQLKDVGKHWYFELTRPSNTNRLAP